MAMLGTESLLPSEMVAENGANWAELYVANMLLIVGASSAFVENRLGVLLCYGWADDGISFSIGQRYSPQYSWDKFVVLPEGGSA